MEYKKMLLMRKIQQCTHILNDLTLYLDTHPTCRKALQAFDKHQKALGMHEDEYEKTYGPLTASVRENDTTWQWVSGPWPWERDTEDKR